MPHGEHHGDDTAESDKILTSAVSSLFGSVKVNSDFDIPYLAGYSKDGKTVYIDQRLERCMKIGARKVDTFKFLVVHEVIEKLLIDKGLKYQHAHQIALRAEEAAVLADDVSQKTYDAHMAAHIKKTLKEPLTKCPADLDLKPYLDEKDDLTVQRIKQAQPKTTPIPKKALDWIKLS